MRRMLPGRGEATMAVALLATNPVAIWFSRKLWDPCLLAMFTVPALLITTRVLERPRTRSLVLLPMLLAAAALTHQSAAFFAVAVAGALSVDTRKMAKIPLLVGLGLAIAMVYPYASFLVDHVAEHGFGGGSRSAVPDIDVLTNVLLDASGHNLLQSAGREAGRLLLWPVPPVGLLIHLAAIPLYAYVLAGFAEVWRPRAPASAGPLSATALRRLLIGVPVGLVILYLAAFVRGVAHYFLVLMPLLAALIVLGDRGSVASVSFYEVNDHSGKLYRLRGPGNLVVARDTQRVEWDPSADGLGRSLHNSSHCPRTTRDLGDGQRTLQERFLGWNCSINTRRTLASAGFAGRCQRLARHRRRPARARWLDALRERIRPGRTGCAVGLSRKFSRIYTD
jgi:4-amino-4-deoxy-L-arabinose transferase-like glycosyltransferase